MERKKVLTGMSGGVDSAAAALLLREAGYEPVGCTLRLYDNEDIGEPQEGTCCSLEAVEDARRACRRLGMEHYVFNFSGAFRRWVMDDFVESYQAGRTPNPCVQCNRRIKFEALIRRADELDIPFIATGHYARVDRDEGTGRWRLLRGLDRRKDQSYFLYPLTQAQLSRLLLPVGNYDKPAIRALAASAGFARGFYRDTAGRSLSPAILWTWTAGCLGGIAGSPAIPPASGGAWASARTGLCTCCARIKRATR